MGTKSIPMDYDPSNDGFYAWIIKLKMYPHGIGPYIQVYEMCFPTRGEAMRLIEPWRDGDWKQDDQGWHCSLKRKAPFHGALEVIVTNLLIVQDDQESDTKTDLHLNGNG